jgi:catechol 2,3-dioxygenase-like lactoylglutathione lyase family enzyme
LLAATACRAQLAAPNDAGVAMGHLHLNVRDVDAERKFWVDGLGATPARLGPMDVFKVPGALIVIRKAEPTGGSEPSVVSHVGFLVRDMKESMARWRAAGVKVDGNPAPDAKQVFLLSPDALRIEMSEDRSIAAPLVIHHLHFYDSAVDDTKAWYVKMFAARPGKRGRFEAADLPGINLTFAPQESPKSGTKGRVLDHIGFEVRNLEEFAKKLEAGGVRFDVPYRKVPALGIAIAFFTDPWGTYIELTEGLDKI